MKAMKKNNLKFMSATLAIAMLGTSVIYGTEVYAEEPEEAPRIIESEEGIYADMINLYSVREGEAENIALSQGVTYFGTKGYSSTLAEKAFDGLLDTNWQASSSVGKAPGKNVGVDAGEGKTLTFNKAVVYENASNGEYRVTEFEIQVSDDLTEWRKVAGGNEIGENPAVLEFETVTARAARFYIVSTIGDYKMPLIAEFELYAGLSNSTTITSSVYEIDKEKKEIIINEGDKVSDLIAAITPPSGGSFEIYNKNGVIPENADLTEDCTVVVTAEDGSTGSYTIKFFKVEPGTNLAMVKGMKFIGVAGYSATGPEKAFDGDYNSYWQAQGSTGAGRRVGLDAGAGKSMTFNTVRIAEAMDGNGIHRITGFQIQITNDEPGTDAGSGIWTTIAEGTRIGDEQIELVFKTQTARAMRFYSTSTEPADKVPLIKEMEVYFIPSSDTMITSENFYIDADKSVIYVAEGTTAEGLMSGITLPIESTAQLTAESGNVISGTKKVEKGSCITVTAQDGVSTAVYTIDYESEIIAEINKIESVDEYIDAVMAVNNKIYNVNIEEYKNLDDVKRDKFKNNLFARRNEIKTAEDMEKLFGGLLFVEKINAADKDGIKELFKSSGDILGLSKDDYSFYDIFLNRYGAGDAVAQKLEAVEFDNEAEIVKMLREETILFAVSKTRNWGEIHSIFTAEDNFPGVDFTKYNDIRDTSDIDDAFVSGVYASYAELIEEIEKEIKDYKPATSGKGSSGGGGGGSSSGGKSDSMKTSTVVTFEQEPTVSKQDKKSFADLSSVEWARESVEKLAGNGVISGKSADMYYPNDKIKREEFVKIIVSAFNIPMTDDENIFSDAKKEDWFSKYINAAYRNGIVSGVSDECFGVGENITRQDMVTILARAAEKAGYKIETDSIKRFADESEMGSYAVPYINKLAAMGVVSGMGDDEFKPKKEATRAEAAVLVHNMLKVIGKM